MTRPRILDLFCGAGGCSVGYSRAGFDVFGVDSDARALRRYPFEHAHMDALEALRLNLPSRGFDAVHASPPCQAYSVSKHTHSKDYPDLLGPVLAALRAWGDHTGRPWVVENVPGAPFPPDVWTVEICGSHRRAFDPATGADVRLRRHRLFASNVPLMAAPCGCDGTTVAGVYGGGSSDLTHARTVRRGGYTPAPAVQRALMGIDWMTNRQLAEAIPPDYCETIGQQLIAHIGAAA